MNIASVTKKLILTAFSILIVQQAYPMQPFLYDHRYVLAAASTTLVVLAVPASRQWVKNAVATVITRLGFICNSDTLIDYGRALHSSSDYRKTICKFSPLHMAADNGDVAMVEKLVKDHADLETTACGMCEGGTPLHCAAGVGPVASVKILVQAGANLNATNWSLWMPIHEAACSNNVDIVKTLAQAGACLTARTNGGSSIAELAPKESSIHDYLEQIESYTKKFMLAIDCHDISMAQQAIDDGALIVQQDQSGATPLHKVIGDYDPRKPTDFDEIAKLIVQTIGRQSRNLRNHAGGTPLHFAVVHDNRRLVRLLIHKGADVNAQDNKGNTPLHYASDQGVIDLLLQNHADITIENHDGEVPISALITQSIHWLSLLERR